APAGRHVHASAGGRDRPLPRRRGDGAGHPAHAGAPGGALPAGAGRRLGGRRLGGRRLGGRRARRRAGALRRPVTPLRELRAAVEDAAAAVAEDARTAGATLERPPRAEFGDYSTNVALLLAPTVGEPPRVVAEQVARELQA